MFTGIITDIGTILSIEQKGDTRFVIETAYEPDSIEIGASIACSGACLTVVERGSENGTNWFSVDASAETLSCTTLGLWEEGTRVNLERALRFGDELGGHLVSGHVDEIGKIVAMQKDGDSTRLSVEAPEKLMAFMAKKGSVVIDGTSLTINEIGENSLNLNIIPHTLCATTIGSYQIGDSVNIEADMFARYLNRLLEARGQ